jgi:hypothetical protein
MRLFSGSLRRRPLVWLALTLALNLIIIIAGIAEIQPATRHPWIGWVGLGLIIYLSVATLAVLPRLKAPPEQAPAMQWTFAFSPF